MTKADEHGRGRRTGLRPTRAEYAMRLSQIQRAISRYASENATLGLTERSIERYVAASHIYDLGLVAPSTETWH